MQAASGEVELSLGSQIRIFAPDGVGKRELTDTINLIPPMETDLEPRAKSQRCPPVLVDKKLPLGEPQLPWAEPDQEKERDVPNLEAGGGVSGGGWKPALPSGMAERRDRALACVYPQASVHQTNCRGLMVNQAAGHDLEDSVLHLLSSTFGR